jgi:hypothetical protein
MKKIVVSVIAVVVILVGGFSFILFTKLGNTVLTPIVNSYISQKIDIAKVKINSLELSPSDITLKGDINSLVNFTIDGDFNIFKQSMDLIYTAKSSSIKIQGIGFDKDLYIKGKVIGDKDKLFIFGVGNISKSKLEYRLNLANGTIQNIKANLNKLNIQDMLTLADIKDYASGSLDLNIDMPTIKEGRIYLSVLDGVVNSSLLKQDFAVELQRDLPFRVDSNSTLKGSVISTVADITTSLGNIYLNKAIYDMENKSLNSNYSFNIDDLSKLRSITKQTLKGKIKVDGVIKKDKNLYIEAKTSSFGGDSRVYYTKDTIKATITQASTKKLLFMLSQPLYIDGLLNSKIVIDDIKKLFGKFSIDLQGVLTKEIINPTYMVSLKSDGILSSQKIKFLATKAVSKLFDLDVTNLTYNIKDNSMYGKYRVINRDLSSLNKITNQRLKGTLQVDGDIEFKDDLIVKGDSKKFGGSMNFVLKNSDLTATIKDASLVKITDTLSYPRYLDAKADANLTYNLDSSKGLLNLEMQKAVMIQNELTNIIKTLRGIDLAKNRFNQALLEARLSKSLIDFDFNAKSKDTTITIDKGEIYQPSQKIKALLNLTIDKDSYRAKIYGTTNSPRLKLDSSYMKEKAKDELKNRAKKKIEKELQKRLNIDSGDQKKVIEGLFKKLF